MLKKLFSALFGGEPTKAPEVTPTEYAGYLIYPEAMAEGGQYRLAGRITKELDGVLQTHRSSAPICLLIRPMPSVSWCRRPTPLSIRWEIACSSPANRLTAKLHDTARGHPAARGASPRR